MKLTFGDIVIVEGNLIGVIVKCWIGKKEHNYDVYVRVANTIENYPESKVERYLVRHKYLSKEEQEYQYNAINGI